MTSPQQPAVRRTGPDDVPLLIELRRAWCAENAGREVEADAAFVESFTDWHQRESDQRVTWLAESDGVPVGMLNLVVFTRMPVPTAVAASRAAQWGYVANVFVLEQHRNRSVGRLLIEAATAYADEHGFAQVLVSPTERSRPFYERGGFGPASRHMMRPGPGK